MNKKGFTLIEVLAVITILTILSIIVLPSVFTMIKKSKENSYNIVVDNFEETARLYTTRHREDVENNLDLYNYYNITLTDLKDDGLLKTPIIDPRTDEVIDLSKKIIVTRETDNSLSVCYEDRGCYIPTLLVNEITKAENIVTGTIQGLHHDTVNDFYYYRGENPNNWIEFNGLLWRIVRVNSDGSIKLIYEGIKNPNGTNENGTIGSRTFDDSNSNNYNNALSVKIALQTWYDTAIDDVNKSKVQSYNFCIGKITYSSTGTSINTFIDNECDILTSSALNVGTISGGEYLSASLDSTCLTAYKTTGDFGQTCKNNNYLYKSTYDYFTITGDETSTNIWSVKSTGSLGIPVAANTTSNVRPVINLITSVIIDRGTGEFDNPYKLKDIVNVDKEKPSITILGDNPIEIEEGDSYVDAGATATDNIDGNLTSRIITLSDLNVNVAGTYNVTYVVSDNSGNKKTASRTIKVITKDIANAPVLSTGMIPIKWSGTDWVNTSVSDSEWYNYEEKKWANAQTADGSFWVWIPRYIYKISSGWHTNTVGTIDVRFSKGIDDTIGGYISLVNTDGANDSNNTWTKHPAFTFGTTEQTGIWVAKFEVSGTTSAIDVKPNVQSLRSTTISDMFTATRNMETNSRYGWGTSGTDLDTHLMKNIEWGAVAYLSKSVYGKETEEIWINPADNYTTGCAGDSVSSSSTTGCLRTYESTNGVKASTTGNIYGIYDMSGGVWEYTSAYVNNGDASLSTYGSSIISADTKYKDIYIMGSSDTKTLNYEANIKKGDALYETSSTGESSTSWFSDYSIIPSASNPWFVRGGANGHTTIAGAFGFSNNCGASGSGLGFRSVLLVGVGL